MTKVLGRITAALTLALLVVPVAPAGAQSLLGSELTVRTREVSFEPNGVTKVTVSVAGTAVQGTLSASNFVVTEEGVAVGGLAAEQLFASKVKSVAVALVMDTSGSTKGASLAAAKVAAKQFIDALPQEVGIELISFGATAHVVTPFTTDRTALKTAIDGLAAAEKTALYDAVSLAALQLGERGNAQHNIVVFSDGDDTVSKATLAQARQAVRAATAPVTSVLLSATRENPAALRTLANAQKGGAFLSVSDSEGLRKAFASVAQAISSQYVLSYHSSALTPEDLSIGVKVNVGSASATDESVFLNERKATQGLRSAAPSTPLVKAFSDSLGLYVGVFAAFLGALFFFGMLFYRPAGKAAEQLLQRGLRLYTRGGAQKKKQQAEGGMLSQTAMGRRAVELAERVPRSKQFDEKMQIQLDQAGWPLRSTEFVLIQIGGTAVGAILGFVLVGRWWVGILLAIFGALAPRLALANRTQKRTSAFLEQLPDTLQLLSGSLQAGYGFLQALDTVAKESTEPTSTEFARVLSEARLGMPLEDALDAMAERVGGEDFKWVVLAINIQRQVGGNLATLLTTVAQTLREREQVRRQIKVLSAEGRLSAVILVALPFALVGYLELINPKYISSLTAETIGKIAIGFALVLIGVGVVWMRKIIKIDV